MLVDSDFALMTNISLDNVACSLPIAVWSMKAQGGNNFEISAISDKQKPVFLILQMILIKIFDSQFLTTIGKTRNLMIVLFLSIMPVSQ